MLRRGALVAGLRGGAAMQLGERTESLRQPADDRERHRQVEHSGAHGGLGRPADRDPDGQRMLHRLRIHGVACRGVSCLANVEELGEPLLEQAVVVAKVEAEERERLDERAAPDHHLRASAGEQIERRELLIEPNRDRRAEYGDRAREPDALRTRRGRREHDGRSGDGELGPVVLADAVDVEARPRPRARPPP